MQVDLQTINKNLSPYTARKNTKRRRQRYQRFQSIAQLDTLTYNQPSIKALKELAIVCAAIKSGDQTVIFRKGGIREPYFKPKAQEFLLFPTGFHEDHSLWKPQYLDKYSKWTSYDIKNLPILEFDSYCEVSGAWLVENEKDVVSALDDLHICSDTFAQKRLKWRHKEPVTVLELRCRSIEPIQRQKLEEWLGCFSWVDIKLDQLFQFGEFVLNDDDFRHKQNILREKLEHFQAQELEILV
eukprot:TRINITY_DN12062_c0_g1_i10.p1 TRINITY_DN12062_c0_g1~~TRINITY_DN12062_c0_g1_i10.p1  ORF type:complete len:241 (-),score=17.09 TRINITY_DN12062_c0_g1_i10:271-993(-)